MVFASSAPLAAGGKKTEVALDVYAVYGTSHTIYISGRVLKRKKIRPPKAKDSRLKNLTRILRRFESDEVAELKIKVTAEKIVARVSTDEEGLFQATLKAPDKGATFTSSQEIEIALDNATGRHTAESLKVRPVIVLSGTVVVVSDIDDTLIDSGVTERAKLVYRLVFENASTLTPIPGTSRLYQSLHARNPSCPIFYLSGSPVNLFQRLNEFLKHHKFPEGALLLKNLGRRKDDDSLMEQKEYKLKRLRELVGHLPEARFVLLGDSGEQDSEIYLTFKKENPEKVLAIFVRRVPNTPKSQKIVDGVSRTEDAFETARQLARQGLISKSAALQVGKEIWGPNTIPAALIKDLNEATECH